MTATFDAHARKLGTDNFHKIFMTLPEASSLRPISDAVLHFKRGQRSTFFKLWLWLSPTLQRGSKTQKWSHCVSTIIRATFSHNAIFLSFRHTKKALSVVVGVFPIKQEKVKDRNSWRTIKINIKSLQGLEVMHWDNSASSVCWLLRRDGHERIALIRRCQRQGTCKATWSRGRQGKSLVICSAWNWNAKLDNEGLLHLWVRYSITLAQRNQLGVAVLTVQWLSMYHRSCISSYSAWQMKQCSELTAADAFSYSALPWRHHADSLLHSMNAKDFLKHCDSVWPLCDHPAHFSSNKCGAHQAVRVSCFNCWALCIMCSA